MQISGSSRFATTSWTLVLRAGRERSAETDRALAELFQAYWYPLYVYARRRVGAVHEAQDLTQEFFTCLLTKDYLQAADRERGRFRTFLLTMFQRFLAKEYEAARAQKRGGGQRLLSLDVKSAEDQYRREPVDGSTPEAIFERQWALTLLERVFEQLRQNYATQGKAELFEACQGYLVGDIDSPHYRAVAERLGLSEGAVKVAVHRLRQRYRDLLRSEVAATVGDESAVDDELQTLLAALREKSSGGV